MQNNNKNNKIEIKSREFFTIPPEYVESRIDMEWSKFFNPVQIHYWFCFFFPNISLIAEIPFKQSWMLDKFR